jgi:hypothetical protein
LIDARVESIAGYEPLLPSRAARVRDLLRLGPFLDARLFAEHAGLVARMGLRCALTRRPIPQLEEAGFELADESPDGVRIYRNPAALPRARLVFEARRASSEADALALVLDASVDPRRVVVLEGEGDGLPECEGSPEGRADILSYRAEEVRVLTSSACPAYLVLADNFLPGWTATVDDREAPILAADFLFRAVELEPGPHEVIFRYRPWSAVAGGALSLLGLAVAAALVRRRAG